jgi:uncharacterized membrane protein (UPF0136 family)
MKSSSSATSSWILGLCILSLLLQVVVGFVSPLSFLSKNNTRSHLDLFKDDNVGVAITAGTGGLTLAGGVLGFVTKGSKASLIAGSTFGGLLLVSGYLSSKGNNNKNGNILGVGVAGMLTYTMGKKFLASKKIMPAGLLAFLGTLSFAYNLGAAFFSSKKAADEKNEADDGKEKLQNSD